MARVLPLLFLFMGALSLGESTPLHAQLICPPGTYPVSAQGRHTRARCVRGRRPAPMTKRPNPPPPAQKEEVITTLGCSEFNRKFSRFHGAYGASYGKQARREDQLIEQTRRIIQSQKNLRNELRKQSMYARDIRVRRHLRIQAQETTQIVREKELELTELLRKNDAKQETWTANYKTLAAKILAQRPPGCKVAAAKQH